LQLDPKIQSRLDEAKAKVNMFNKMDKMKKQMALGLRDPAALQRYEQRLAAQR